MWKLTITQTRKSEHGDYTVTDTVEYLNETLLALTTLIMRLTDCEEVHETTYKIEKVGEKDGIQEVEG